MGICNLLIDISLWFHKYNNYINRVEVFECGVDGAARHAWKRIFYDGCDKNSPVNINWIITFVVRIFLILLILCNRILYWLMFLLKLFPSSLFCTILICELLKALSWSFRGIVLFVADKHSVPLLCNCILWITCHMSSSEAQMFLRKSLIVRPGLGRESLWKMSIDELSMQ